MVDDIYFVIIMNRFRGRSRSLVSSQFTAAPPLFFAVFARCFSLLFRAISSLKPRKSAILAGIAAVFSWNNSEYQRSPVKQRTPARVPSIPPATGEGQVFAAGKAHGRRAGAVVGLDVDEADHALLDLLSRQPRVACPIGSKKRDETTVWLILLRRRRGAGPTGTVRGVPGCDSACRVP
jgi:hypothetical protein